MLRTIIASGFLVAACGNADRTAAEPSPERPAPETVQNIEKATAMPTLSDVTFTSITGDAIPTDTFDGKAVLVVNTASRCGYTPQYQGLQELWTEYGDKGLVVLGVPSNDFGGQEPGTEAQVKEFCEINYGVTFPLTQKEKVSGPGAHEFYALASDALGESAQPKWNFHKVLIGKDGVPIKAFPSNVKPTDDELLTAIEGTLAS